MQQWHAQTIVAEVVRYTSGPLTAKRVLDEAELLLDDGGFRLERGGQFFALVPAMLETILERAAELTGVQLLTPAERDEKIKARIADRVRRDWL